MQNTDGFENMNQNFMLSTDRTPEDLQFHGQEQPKRQCILIKGMLNESVKARDTLDKVLKGYLKQSCVKLKQNFEYLVENVPKLVMPEEKQPMQQQMNYEVQLPISAISKCKSYDPSSEAVFIVMPDEIIQSEPHIQDQWINKHKHIEIIKPERRNYQLINFKEEGDQTFDYEESLMESVHNKTEFQHVIGESQQQQQFMIISIDDAYQLEQLDVSVVGHQDKPIAMYPYIPSFISKQQFENELQQLEQDQFEILK